MLISWPYRDFDHAIHPTARNIVRRDDLVEAEGARDQRDQIQPAATHYFNEPAHAFLTALITRNCV
jgi:hypothetical protein